LQSWGIAQQVAIIVKVQSTQPTSAALGAPSSAAPAPAITAPVALVVCAKTVRKLVASLKPSAPTASSPIQKVLDRPSQPRLKAKSRVTMIESAPLRFTSPAVSKSPEPISAPTAGAA